MHLFVGQFPLNLPNTTKMASTQMHITDTDFSDLRVKIRPGQTVYIPGEDLDEAAFYTFCLNNRELRIERDSNGEIHIALPTNSETGRQNAELGAEIGIWNRRTKLGYVFDSSTMFKLPNGAERSPDVSWVRKERWEALSAEQQQRFAPIMPDFVIELRSGEQSLTELRDKMEEYMACGAQLGWLIDAKNRRTYVYTANGDIQTVSFDLEITGGEVMPGFMLKLGELW